MAFGDNIASLGTQVSPDNAGGSCNLAITIPANSTCIVFGLVCQGTVGTTNADLSDSQSLTWTPLKDGTTKLLIEDAATIGKAIFAWFFNNETGSPISTTLTLARGSPGTNAAGRSFSLSAMSFDGKMAAPTNYSVNSEAVSATGDPSAQLTGTIPSTSVAVACYLSVGPNQTIMSTPADLTRVSLHNTYPDQRQSDLQAGKNWPNTTSAWSTNDAGAVAFLFEAAAVSGGTPTTISITPAVLSYSGQNIVVNSKTNVPITAASISYTGQNIGISALRTISILPATISHVGQNIAVGANAVISIAAATINYAGQNIVVNSKTLISIVAATMSNAGQSITVNSKTAISVGQAVINHVGQTVAINSKRVIPISAAVIEYVGQNVGLDAKTRIFITAATIHYAGKFIDIVDALSGTITKRTQRMGFKIGVGIGSKDN